MRPRLIALALLAAWLLACSSQTGADDGPLRLTSSGVARSYLLHAPAPERLGAPLLIVLHGRGSNAAEMRAMSGFDALADRGGFVVAYPQGEHQGWGDRPVPSEIRPDPSADVRFLTELIGMLVETRGVDSRQVWIAGFSNGGSMALRLAADRPDLVGGVAAVAGQLPIGVSPTEPVPLLLFYGDRDPIRPIGGLPSPPPAEAGTEGSTPTIGARDTAAAFAAAGGASPPVTDTLPDGDPGDGTRMTRTTWHAGDHRREVVFLTVAGGGHTWPSAKTPAPAEFGTVSRDLDASGAIVERMTQWRGQRRPHR